MFFFIISKNSKGLSFKVECFVSMFHNSFECFMTSLASRSQQMMQRLQILQLLWPLSCLIVFSYLLNKLSSEFWSWLIFQLVCVTVAWNGMPESRAVGAGAENCIFQNKITAWLIEFFFFFYHTPGLWLINKATLPRAESPVDTAQRSVKTWGLMWKCPINALIEWCKSLAYHI